MKKQTISLESTGYFSKLFLDYISGRSTLEPFYSLPPNLESFASQMQSKKFDFEHRQILHQALIEQYSGLSTTQAVNNNFENLKNEKTYTVTTGHQLNIFGGPLYFIYKIVTVINLSRRLKERYPDAHFVPVFWMASEDHDFEEISTFSLFNKKYTWESTQKGGVGRMNTSGIENILAQISEPLPLFDKAYKAPTLAEATRTFVNELFGNYGLVVVDGDNRALKGLFKKTIKSELTDQPSYKFITESSQTLSALGYNPQVNPREINLFYLDNGLRERIVLEGDRFKVLNTDLEFSRTEIFDLVENSPEKFSPNVVLRPLYQETVLPNLSYTGGPAEGDYWLQLKAMFDHYDISFPIIVPRNFVLYVNKVAEKKMNKLNISAEELFLSLNDLKQLLLNRVSGEINLDTEKAQLEEVFKAIVQKTLKIDGSLEGYINSEKQKTMKSFDEILKRLKKADEKKNEDLVRQIEGVKEKLFPNGALQERHDNFLNFFINEGNFIDKVIQTLDPLEFSFNVLTDDE